VTRWLNALELSCLLVQAASVLLGLLSYDDGVDANAQGGFGYAVLVLNIAPVAAVVLMAAYLGMHMLTASILAGDLDFMLPCCMQDSGRDGGDDGVEGNGNGGRGDFTMDAGTAVSGLALAARARRKEQARAARAAKKEDDLERQRRIEDLTAGAVPMSMD